MLRWASWGCFSSCTQSDSEKVETHDHQLPDGERSTYIPSHYKTSDSKCADAGPADTRTPTRDTTTKNLESEKLRKQAYHLPVVDVSFKLDRGLAVASKNNSYAPTEPECVICLDTFNEVFAFNTARYFIYLKIVNCSINLQ